MVYILPAYYTVYQIHDSVYWKMIWIVVILALLILAISCGSAAEGAAAKGCFFSNEFAFNTTSNTPVYMHVILLCRAHVPSLLTFTFSFSFLSISALVWLLRLTSSSPGKWTNAFTFIINRYWETCRVVERGQDCGHDDWLSRCRLTASLS